MQQIVYIKDIHIFKININDKYKYEMSDFKINTRCKFSNACF